MGVQLTESPRDAMQGLDFFIPTEKKVEYIQSLLRVGFHTIDVGSFVSPKAVPQLRDTGEVLARLDMRGSHSRLMVVAGNLRGAREACEHNCISAIGFPFSISESFLRSNINSDLERSSQMVEGINEICLKAKKELMLYITMAFGNPYDDPWSVEVLERWVGHFVRLGIREINLSDPMGMATPDTIHQVYARLFEVFPTISFGFHLHTGFELWKEKIDAAYRCGCRSYDGVLNGLGGCPMTGHGLVANIRTSNLIEYLSEQGENCRLDTKALMETTQLGEKLFILRQ